MGKEHYNKKSGIRDYFDIDEPHILFMRAVSRVVMAAACVGVGKRLKGRMSA